MSIRIFYDGVRYRYKGWLKFKYLIGEIIAAGKMMPGEISIIITDDQNLKKINIQFLEHDYFTDVITFNNKTGNLANGEIYISLDTVRENAKNYKVSLHNELCRVMIHGVLHLTGHDDKTEREKKAMRDMEDHWLKFAGE